MTATPLPALDFATLGALLLIAALVAIVTQRLRLPYAVGLVLAGIGLKLFDAGPAVSLTPQLIFLVFLPPLIFEAAVQLPWRPFRRELPLLLVLVTLGVVVAAAVVAIGMRIGAGWSVGGAVLFGILIAATDPVSVIAAFKAIRVPARLHLLVEAESVLNDGVAAVGFGVVAAIVTGGETSVGAVTLALIQTIAGGILAGAVVAVPLILLATRTGDRLVEVTLTTLIAYGSFLLADHFHCSGVLATLTAGLIVGNWGFDGRISAEGRQGVLNLWEYVAFLVNSIIFLLIGGQSAAMPVARVASVAGLAIALTLVARAAAVYPIALAFARSAFAVSPRYTHILFWGGLRGALALALALALPMAVPERGAIIAVAFVVVAFSIIVQGLTIPLLIRRLGLAHGHATRDDHGTPAPNAD